MLEINKPASGLKEDLWYWTTLLSRNFRVLPYFQLLKVSGITDILADFLVPLSKLLLSIAQLRSLPEENRDYHIKNS